MAALAEAGRTEWPELVGVEKEAARGALAAARPDLTVLLVPSGGIVTMDWRENRVRVFFGEDGKVARAPRVG
jgi:hypothetical protein